MAYPGYTGNAHDFRVFRVTTLRNNPGSHFQNGEYLLADSAYAPSLTIVPIIKKSGKKDLSREEKDFNFCHANTRVTIEHCIGILKGRFQSLRGLRIPISKKHHIQRANWWIYTCCMLHNFLIDNKDNIDPSWEEEFTSSFPFNDSPAENESVDGITDEN